jgi:FkbM family methyltransferase
MSRVKAQVSAMASRMLSLLPASALSSLERSVSGAQGKGWGSGTIDAEVSACVLSLPAPLRRAPLVLDVGANVGAWSAALLRLVPNATVVAFEPSTVAYAALESALGGDPRVTCVQAAVGAREGEATLWADAPGSGMASLSRRQLDHAGIAFDHSEPVRMVTLDAWCDEASIHPVLVKMDVEGHEWEVLQGAARLLSEVAVVQFEFGGANIDTRTYFHDFHALLTDAGFDIHRLGPRGLQPVRSYREQDETFRTTNYLAVRP